MRYRWRERIRSSYSAAALFRAFFSQRLTLDFFSKAIFVCIEFFASLGVGKHLSRIVARSLYFLAQPFSMLSFIINIASYAITMESIDFLIRQIMRVAVRVANHEGCRELCHEQHLSTRSLVQQRPELHLKASDNFHLSFRLAP